MNKRIWVAIGVAMAVVGGLRAQEQEQAPAVDPARRVLAEQLMEVMKVRQTIESSMQMVKQMIPLQMEKMAKATGQTNMPSGVSDRTEQAMDLMAKELSWDNMKGDFIALYAGAFTEDELKGIIAFYKSPVGQALIAKQPELMKQSVALTQKMMMRIMPKLKELGLDLKAGRMPRAQMESKEGK